MSDFEETAKSLTVGRETSIQAKIRLMKIWKLTPSEKNMWDKKQSGHVEKLDHQSQKQGILKIGL